LEGKELVISYSMGCVSKSEFRPAGADVEAALELR
jgi:hypothetical protein